MTSRPSAKLPSERRRASTGPATGSTCRSRCCRGEVGLHPEAGVRLDVPEAARPDGLARDRVHAAADAGVAAAWSASAGVEAVEHSLPFAGRVARVERRADGDAALDADDPGGLRVVALLVEDRPVEAEGEVVDAAARGAVEGHAEELPARGVGEELGRRRPTSRRDRRGSATS